MASRDFDFLERALPAMDRVYNLARRCTSGRQDAEDAVQETYLRALRSWRTGHRPERVEAWLATICLNVIRSDYRRRSRRPAEPYEPGRVSELPGDEATEEAALGSIEAAAVHRALRELPEEQRVALVLVDICGFTTTETARITRAPRGTVLSRVHRGRKALAGARALKGVRHDEA